MYTSIFLNKCKDAEYGSLTFGPGARLASAITQPSPSVCGKSVCIFKLVLIFPLHFAAFVACQFCFSYSSQVAELHYVKQGSVMPASGAEKGNAYLAPARLPRSDFGAEGQQGC